MENINKAIEYAMNAQPIEFKAAIGDALADKIADAIQMRKIEELTLYVLELESRIRLLESKGLR